MTVMTVYGLDIPEDVTSLEGFRRWAEGLDEHGPRIHFSRGRIHIETSPQHVETHGPLVQAVNLVLAALSAELDLGCYYMPPTWFTHPESGLSTEPDGFAVRWETLESGGFRVNRARKCEFLGRPDMTLEVVSRSSATKDLEDLVNDHATAGVEEYWIADAREGEAAFRILVLRRGRYRDVKPERGGWIASRFWGRSFRVVKFANRAGRVDFRLEVRARKR